MSHSFEEEDEIPRTGAPFDEAEFREKVTKNLVEFDRKNFPAENWANHCWQQYNIYALCLKKNDGDEDACQKQKFNAYGNCPNQWVEDWNEQREKGTFLGVQTSNPWKNRKSGHH